MPKQNQTQPTATDRQMSDIAAALKQADADGVDLGLDGYNLGRLTVHHDQSIGSGFAVLSKSVTVFQDVPRRNGETFERMVGVSPEGAVTLDGRNIPTWVIFTDYNRKARGQARFDKEGNENLNRINSANLQALKQSGCLEDEVMTIGTYGGYMGTIPSQDDPSIGKRVAVISLSDVYTTSGGNSFKRMSPEEVDARETTVPTETKAQERKRLRDEARAAAEPETASV